MRVSKRVDPAIQACINKFEANGFEVHLKHGQELDANGSPVRFTSLTLNDEMVEGRGVAMCSPNDNFDKAKGTEIAFQRAVQDLSQWIGRGAMKRILK